MNFPLSFGRFVLYWRIQTGWLGRETVWEDDKSLPSAKLFSTTSLERSNGF